MSKFRNDPTLNSIDQTVDETSSRASVCKHAWPLLQNLKKILFWMLPETTFEPTLFQHFCQFYTSRFSFFAISSLHWRRPANLIYQSVNPRSHMLNTKTTFYSSLFSEMRLALSLQCLRPKQGCSKKYAHVYKLDQL